MTAEIQEFIALWAPSISAIIGIIVSAIYGIKKITAMVKRSNNEITLTVETIRQSKELKEATQQMGQLANENRELRESIDILTNKLADVEGYVSEVKKGYGNKD